MGSDSKKVTIKSNQDKNASSITKMLEIKKLVYLATADTKSGNSLARQISHFGYRVQIVKDLRKLENEVAKHMAIAILVDISSFEEQSSERDVFEQIKQWERISTPLIIISDRDNQAVRLQAIRAGGVAFITKPIDMVSLIDKLDRINTSQEEDPYRVLIVEDQPTIASYYQMVLKMAGMSTQIVTDSTEVLWNIQEFHPDLILLDLYMPHDDGIQLAKLIRQIDEYVSTPIVFLSSEENFSKQIEAMNLGGDDFLTKPIKASHLVAMVKSRLERLRILRSFMVRDSLTGLLNHTSFRGQLTQEINRSERHDMKLALAMLDIDHFKQINDTFGHPVGDTVLKSISRLLQQRLRKTDVFGRYGGEEFGVLLLDADSNSAFQVMDEIREHFSQLQHFSPQKGIFTVTFSCGIATYPEFQNATLLIDAADQALYAAKAAGRNRVMLVG